MKFHHQLSILFPSLINAASPFGESSESERTDYTSSASASSLNGNRSRSGYSGADEGGPLKKPLNKFHSAGRKGNGSVQVESASEHSSSESEITFESPVPIKHSPTVLSTTINALNAFLTYLIVIIVLLYIIYCIYYLTLLKEIYRDPGTIKGDANDDEEDHEEVESDFKNFIE